MPGKAEPHNPEPEKDHVGALWHAVALPHTAKDLRTLADCLAQYRSTDPGLAPTLTFQIPHHRYAYAVLSWTYDRRHADQETQILENYRSVKSTLAERGYRPYRLGWSDQPASPKNEAWQALRAHFDPAGILAPGHYLP